MQLGFLTRSVLRVVVILASLTEAGHEAWSVLLQTKGSGMFTLTGLRVARGRQMVMQGIINHWS